MSAREYYFSVLQRKATHPVEMQVGSMRSWPNIVKVKGSVVTLNAYEFLGRSLAVSRGRLTWRSSLCCCLKPDLGEISYWNSVCYVWNRVCFAGANFCTAAAKVNAVNIVGEIRVNPLSDNSILKCYISRNMLK